MMLKVTDSLAFSLFIIIIMIIFCRCIKEEATENTNRIVTVHWTSLALLSEMNGKTIRNENKNFLHTTHRNEF